MFVKNNDYKTGDFIYLYPSQNDECKAGVEEYTQTFNVDKENHFIPLNLEKLVGTIKAFCSDNWILDFENRYLNLEKINNISF
jgi:hypothetical protein